jgi:hypothetical protein
MKMATDDHDHANGAEKDSIPTYLALTDESFNDFVQNFVDKTNPISIQDVQHIALCQHRIAKGEKADPDRSWWIHQDPLFPPWFFRSIS